MKKALVIGIVLLFIGASVVSGFDSFKNYQPSAKADKTEGLVAYWSFNNQSNPGNDDSGNNHHGTVIGATWIPNGVINGAMSFNGDDYISLPDFTSSYDKGTVVAWVKHSLPDDITGLIYAEGNETSEINKPYIWFGFKGGKLHFARDVYGGVSNYQGVAEVGGNDGLWHFVVFLSDGSANRFYFDDEEVFPIWQNSNVPPGIWFDDQITDTNSIGVCNQPMHYGFFNGTIDEVRMYDRALTEEEIHELFTPLTVYVDDDFNSSTPGWGYDHFSSIQDGINAVDVGGTVFVYSGVYTEELGVNPDPLDYISISKALNLIGENKLAVIINCPTTDEGGANGIRINEGISNVNISGFTIKGNNTQGSIGIYLCYFYIENVTIIDCIVYSFAEGICLYSNSNCVVRNCITYDNFRNGGIVSYSGNNNIITDCVSYSNSYGIYLATTSSIIYHNNLYNNTVNAYDTGANTWYNLALQEGNYYDDYTGEDNNGDGIGDTPYNIPGGSNQDLYPLMHPFGMYYILNISLESHEVNEGATFSVTVKTLGGTTVSNAYVLFDDQIYSTDQNGKTVITAPMVAEDTLYPIVASKSGYTSDNDTIVVKNVPTEFIRAFIFGKITNLSTQGEYITFEAVKTRVIICSPFSFNTYVSGEQFTIEKTHFGFINVGYIFALCRIQIRR